MPSIKAKTGRLMILMESTVSYELSNEKPGFLHMRQQRRRSAAQLLRS